MTAGLHMQVHIWEINYSSDDTVGGAVTTGTVRHAHLPAILTPRMTSHQSLEMGLEADRIYDFTCKRDGITINERDEIQVVWPDDHPLYNLRFRVTGIQPGRRRNRYGAFHCTLSRIEHSRSRQ